MTFKDIFALMRIHQWIKNFFVFAALIFSTSLFLENRLIIIIYTFLLFCLASSSIYIINDLLDVKQDRLHPKKKFRPIASGKIKPTPAFIISLILMSMAIVGSYIINIGLFVVVVAYIVMNLLYSKWLKHVVILDTLIIAMGYVLRVIAGGLAIGVYMSPWLLGMTLTLSLMIALAKRHSELINQTNKRKVLEHYDINFVNLLLVLSSTLTITIYLLWCIENRLQTNESALIASSLFVVYGIMRYLYLVLKTDKAESPTKIMLKDRAMQLTVVLWGLFMIVLIYL